MTFSTFGCHLFTSVCFVFGSLPVWSSLLTPSVDPHRLRKVFEMSLSWFLLSSVLAFCKAASKPNIIFILTDDQDILLNGFSTMNQTQALLVDQGMIFNNAFVSSPVCCVSRSSIMTGRYVHNTGAYNNSFDGGCSNTSWQQGPEKRTFAVQALNAGYQTFYSGLPSHLSLSLLFFEQTKR